MPGGVVVEEEKSGGAVRAGRGRSQVRLCLCLFQVCVCAPVC